MSSTDFTTYDQTSFTPTIIGDGGLIDTDQHNIPIFDEEDTLTLSGQIIYWPGVSECYDDMVSSLNLGDNYIECQGNSSQIINNKVTHPLFTPADQSLAYAQAIQSIYDNVTDHFEQLQKLIPIANELIFAGKTKEAKQLAITLFLDVNSSELNDDEKIICYLDLAFVFDRLGKTKKTDTCIESAIAQLKTCFIADSKAQAYARHIFNTLKLLDTPRRKDHITTLETYQNKFQDPHHRITYIGHLANVHHNKEKAIEWFSNGLSLLETNRDRYYSIYYLAYAEEMSTAYTDLETQAYNLYLTYFRKEIFVPYSSNPTLATQPGNQHDFLISISKSGLSNSHKKDLIKKLYTLNQIVCQSFDSPPIETLNFQKRIIGIMQTEMGLNLEEVEQELNITSNENSSGKFY